MAEKTAPCVVITGASSGLGAALARQYAAKGSVLGLIGRHAERLHRVAEECRALGGIVETMLVDVTDREACALCLKQFDANYPIDICIANAAVTNYVHKNKTLEAHNDVQRLLATNLGGVINTLHAVIPFMQKRQYGQLVIISSLAAFRGLPITPSYCASKSAISAYGEALRANLAAEGLVVSLVYPGFILSPMSEQLPTSKPFMISAERAAIKMMRGIEKQRARIIFPYRLYLGMVSLKLIPSRWGDWVLQKISF